jgi:prepilin-type N-terminal cleavage/methylation domain-containing protein
MRRQRGFSLIEVLAGLLILSIVVTTSLAVVYQREVRVRDAEALILVWQTIANEAELLRRVPYAALDARSGQQFATDVDLLSGINGATTSVTVAQAQPDVKEVVLTVTWGERVARMSVLRTDTAGGNLW